MNIFEQISRNFSDGAELGPTFPLRHISGLLGRKYHVTAVKGAGTIRIRPKTSDAQTFVDIFRHKTYDLSRWPQFRSVMAAYQRLLDAGQIPIIIDAGANVGAASIWFSRQFPRARILAIEPDAENVALCRLNTSGLPNVKIIEAAIGSESGSVSLKNPTNQAWAIQATRDEEGKTAVCTIPDIVRAEQSPAKLFLVKVDIEGFEDDLFADNTGWIDAAEVIIIEPHDWLFAGKGTSKNFQKAIGSGNFEILIYRENLIYIRLHSQK